MSSKINSLFAKTQVAAPATEDEADAFLHDRDFLSRLDDKDLYALFRVENMEPEARALYDAAFSRTPLPPEKQLSIVGQKRGGQPVQFEHVKDWQAVTAFITSTLPRFPAPLVDELVTRIRAAQIALDEKRADYPAAVRPVRTPLSHPVPTLLFVVDPLARRRQALRPASVADIVGYFDEKAFSVPVASVVEVEQDNGDVTWIFAVTDANHRITGAHERKYTLIENVEVILDATKLDRAQTMFGRNVPQTALAKSDVIRNGLNAQDPQTVAARDLITAAGLVPLLDVKSKSADPSRVGMPITTVLALFGRFDVSVITRVLSLYDDETLPHWGAMAADSEATRAPMVQALCRLVELERDGVIPTFIMYECLKQWAPSSLVNVAEKTTPNHRWFCQHASKQSEASRSRKLVAVLAERCHNLTNAAKGISPIAVLTAATDVNPNQVTQEDLKLAVAYKKQARKLISTFVPDGTKVSKTDREKLRVSRWRLRQKLNSLDLFCDWWVANGWVFSRDGANLFSE